MHITILTLFPEMFVGPFDHSIVKRAKQKGLLTINIVNIRDYATDKHKSVDDRPYGGGTGMIMRVDVIDRAIKEQKHVLKEKTIFLDPKGTPYTQAKARELSRFDHLILICGHYEGVDERVSALVDESISVGDYILTGGEIPAMVLVDSVIRLIPRVLARAQAVQLESFSDPSRLEHPQYTRPQTYQGMSVPKILLSGNHALMTKWRAEKALGRTRERRADLLR